MTDTHAAEMGNIQNAGKALLQAHSSIRLVQPNDTYRRQLNTNTFVIYPSTKNSLRPT